MEDNRSLRKIFGLILLGLLYNFCITISTVPLTGILVNRLSKSNEVRRPLLGLLESNMSRKSLFLLDISGSINLFRVLDKLYTRLRIYENMARSDAFVL